MTSIGRNYNIVLDGGVLHADRHAGFPVLGGDREDGGGGTRENDGRFYMHRTLFHDIFLGASVS